MDILSALLIAEKTIELGDVFVSALKKHGKETISKEELERLFELPSFKDEETGDNNTDDQ